MAALDVGDENFRELYKNNETIVLDFWAPWCGPCQNFLPIFEKSSEKEKFSDVVFGKINTEQEQKLAAYFGIRSIPTVIIIKNELEVFRSKGSLAQADLESLVDEVKATSIDKIKSKLGITD